MTGKEDGGGGGEEKTEGGRGKKKEYTFAVKYLVIILLSVCYWYSNLSVTNKIKNSKISANFDKICNNIISYIWTQEPFTKISRL